MPPAKICNTEPRQRFIPYTNQSEPTKVEANGWEQYKENLEEYSITIMDGKPVPNVIKENGTVTLPETVQRVLDAARLFGL